MALKDKVLHRPTERMPDKALQLRELNRHLIDLRGLVKTYQSAAGTFTALNGIDLQARIGCLRLHYR